VEHWNASDINGYNAMMDARLEIRWREVHEELARLASGKAHPIDYHLTDREKELLAELDRIEYEVGAEYLSKTVEGRGT
jgi:hypothetical protein